MRRGELRPMLFARFDAFGFLRTIWDSATDALLLCKNMSEGHEALDHLKVSPLELILHAPS